MRRRGIRRVLAALFGLLGLGGIAFLLVGLALARPWSAERTITVQAPPAAVFLYLDSLALWDRWTVWDQVGSTFSGPGRGAGARRTWDDARYGEGAFVLTHSDQDRRLRYEVVVEGGAIRIRGDVRLTPGPGGTRVTWREDGELARNPLLGYVAGSISRSQGEEMARSLSRLKTVVEGPASEP